MIFNYPPVRNNTPAPPSIHGITTEESSLTFWANYDSATMTVSNSISESMSGDTVYIQYYSRTLPPGVVLYVETSTGQSIVWDELGQKTSGRNRYIFYSFTMPNFDVTVGYRASTPM